MSLMQLRQLTEKNKLLIVTLQIIRLTKQKSYIAGERQYQARWIFGLISCDWFYILNDMK